jgi:hypothetical protein
MTAVLIVLVWIICSGIAAFLAWTKGRSVTAWFFCGLAFGVFGVIAAALARPQEELNARPQLSRHL